jgi:hypothetical protein
VIIRTTRAGEVLGGGVFICRPQARRAWLRATITYLRMVIPIVANPRVEASLQKLSNAMERRRAALQHRRMHPLDMDEPPGR